MDPIFDNSDSDPDLLAALEASLRDPAPASPRVAPALPQNDIVDLTGDSEESSPETEQPSSSGKSSDSKLSKAISRELNTQATYLPSSLSRDRATHVTHSESVVSPRRQQRSIPKETASQSVFGCGGIDRKKMEEERLSRLAKKRKAQDASPPPTAKQAKILSTTDTPIGERIVQQGDIGVKKSPKPALAKQSPQPIAPLQYPTGVVKKTWAFGYPRDCDIKIEEVFQRSDIELAILSSFQWDTDWLFSKFGNSRPRLLLLMQAKEEALKAQMERDTSSMTKVRLCFPPMGPQVNCMHSKLMLLFHPNHLRVVVPSANLVPYDWGESGGIMENIVFLIDLPRKSTGADDEPPTKFLEELVYFLKASTVHDNIIDKLSGFDFGATADIAFVHTIGGSHTRDTWKRTGVCGLGNAVDNLGLRTSQPLTLDYVTSSVGFLNETFMRSVYLAAQGDNGLKELTLRTSKSFPSTKFGFTVKKTDGAEWSRRFNVYFPSQQTVETSKGGSQSAGTLCFQSKWYTSPTFPKQVMRDNLSRRNGLLMHNKMLFVRPDTPVTSSDGNSVCHGWAYVGSANLSESAWGRLVVDRSTTQPKLNCRNWECGVLIPIRKPLSPDTAEMSGGSAPKASGDTFQVFNDWVPVPMRVPGPEYGTGKQPWFYME
ncbi:hypothetical protein AJ80_09450 [Polytolypa hystricis UAMH7299]|uniref:PLD phosphodiesterase domain-containing protein n=1 Tax=Polytolypa hystricis (strain UAMH7299) TaxID=1447883 RepID=A0A2B7WQL5_POLH7|nr:hypothetical protein AJ80_09450 [Polytolypa hystricis UAMH7299]